MSTISDLGVLIDSEDEVFKSTIEDYNVGVLNSLCSFMEDAYAKLALSKDLIIQSKDISTDEKSEVLKGIYSEMLKIETKVSIIKNRIEYLRPKVFSN